MLMTLIESSSIWFELQLSFFSLKLWHRSYGFKYNNCAVGHSAIARRPTCRAEKDHALSEMKLRIAALRECEVLPPSFKETTIKIGVVSKF